MQDDFSYLPSLCLDILTRPFSRQIGPELIDGLIDWLTDLFSGVSTSTVTSTVDEETTINFANQDDDNGSGDAQYGPHNRPDTQQSSDQHVNIATNFGPLLETSSTPKSESVNRSSRVTFKNDVDSQKSSSSTGRQPKAYERSNEDYTGRSFQVYLFFYLVPWVHNTQVHTKYTVLGILVFHCQVQNGSWREIDADYGRTIHIHFTEVYIFLVHG